MYIETNNEKILISFNPHPKVQIQGPENFYFVELTEYLENELRPRVVESYEITTNPTFDWEESEFKCFIEFYTDFEISIYKFVDGVGLQRIHTHRFNENGQAIKFNLHTKDEDDCKLWVDRILEYKRIKSCFVNLNSFYKDINNLSDIHLESDDEYYKVYNIGRFPKISTDFRTTDERMEGLVWLGNWKTFWSYQHPRLWVDLSSKEIIDDILGLK